MRRVNLIPTAGAGQRFVDAGYNVPKPLIEIDGLPMVVQAAKTLPPADKWIFICREEHNKNNNILRPVTFVNSKDDLEKYFEILSLKYDEFHLTQFNVDEYRHSDEDAVDFVKYFSEN